MQHTDETVSKKKKYSYTWDHTDLLLKANYLMSCATKPSVSWTVNRLKAKWPPAYEIYLDGFIRWAADNPRVVKLYTWDACKAQYKNTRLISNQASLVMNLPGISQAIFSWYWPIHPYIRYNKNVFRYVNSDMWNRLNSACIDIVRCCGAW